MLRLQGAVKFLPSNFIRKITRSHNNLSVILTSNMPQTLVFRLINLMCLFFYRDGVSESQFEQVLNVELKQIIEVGSPLPPRLVPYSLHLFLDCISSCCPGLQVCERKLVSEVHGGGGTEEA